MIWSLRRPSIAALERLRERQRDLPPTYDEHGATLGALPGRYHVHRDVIAVGAGRGAFGAACASLRGWSAHRAHGMALSPETPPLVEGSTMAFALQVAAPFPLWVSGCCRIVRVVDGPRCFGFAYGTLPHHPERGEEAFLVHHRTDDDVEFEIVAFSRPASVLVGLSGPIGRWMQRRSVRRYLEGLRDDVRAAASRD